MEAYYFVNAAKIRKVFQLFASNTIFLHLFKCFWRREIELGGKKCILVKEGFLDHLSTIFSFKSCLSTIFSDIDFINWSISACRCWQWWRAMQSRNMLRSSLSRVSISAWMYSACFLAEFTYHHAFIAWLIEREVVAVLRGNLLNLHTLGQIAYLFLS